MRKIGGYSLLEIVITLFIIVIAVTFLIPSQRHFYQFSMSKNVGFQLFHALSVARDEALLRGRSIVLCKSIDLKTCSGDWREGFIIKEGNKILYTFRPNLSGGAIHWRAFPNHYQELEFLRNGASKMENGTFWFCLKYTENPLWAIVLSQSGRVRMVYPDRDGRIYDDNLRLIKC